VSKPHLTLRVAFFLTDRRFIISACSYATNTTMVPKYYNLAFYQYNTYNSYRFGRTSYPNRKWYRCNNLQQNGNGVSEREGNNGMCSSDVLRLAVDSVCSNKLGSNQRSASESSSFGMDPVYQTPTKIDATTDERPMSPKMVKAEKNMVRYGQAQKVTHDRRNSTKASNQQVLKQSTKDAMSKSMRNKFYQYRKEGLSEQQAYEKAKPAFMKYARKNGPPKGQQPGKKRDIFKKIGARTVLADRNEIPQNNGRLNSKKRRLESDSSDPLVPAKKKKMPQISIGENIKAIEICVAPEAYPLEKITAKTFENLKTSVEMQLAEQKVGEVKPQFTQRPIFKCGTIAFHCRDRSTANWLQALPLWTNQECMTWEEPEKCIHRGHFLHSAKMPTNQVLSMIQGQNTDLCTQNWRMINRWTKAACLVLELELDQESHDRLEALEWRVNFGFGQQVKLAHKERNCDEIAL
jgi:Domain of unknown function (DUF4780)